MEQLGFPLLLFSAVVCGKGSFWNVIAATCSLLTGRLEQARPYKIGSQTCSYPNFTNISMNPLSLVISNDSSKPSWTRISFGTAIRLELLVSCKREMPQHQSSFFLAGWTQLYALESSYHFLLNKLITSIKITRSENRKSMLYGKKQGRKRLLKECLPKRNVNYLNKNTGGIELSPIEPGEFGIESIQVLKADSIIGQPVDLVHLLDILKDLTTFGFASQPFHQLLDFLHTVAQPAAVVLGGQGRSKNGKRKGVQNVPSPITDGQICSETELFYRFLPV